MEDEEHEEVTACEVERNEEDAIVVFDAETEFGIR